MYKVKAVSKVKIPKIKTLKADKTDSKTKILHTILTKKNALIENGLHPTHLIINDEKYNKIKDCAEIKDLTVITVNSRTDIVII